MVRLICFLAVGRNANVPCRSVWGMVAFPIESHIAMSGTMNWPVCGSVEELCSRQLQNTNMLNSLCTQHCYRVSVHGIVTESLYAALLQSLFLISHVPPAHSFFEKRSILENILLI